MKRSPGAFARIVVKQFGREATRSKCGFVARMYTLIVSGASSKLRRDRREPSHRPEHADPPYWQRRRLYVKLTNNDGDS